MTAYDGEGGIIIYHVTEDLLWKISGYDPERPSLDAMPTQGLLAGTMLFSIALFF